MKTTDSRGFTLLEVMVTMAVLTIGLLGVAAMQTRAISTNTSSMSRLNANALALSVMEELRRLPINDAILDDTDGDGNDDPDADGITALDDGLPPPLGLGAVGADGFPDLTVTPADHSVIDAGFINNFPGIGNTSFRVVGAGAQTRLVDESNREYLLFYNVDEDPWGDGTQPFSVIKLFVFWRSSLGGVSHIEMTSTKNG